MSEPTNGTGDRDERAGDRAALPARARAGTAGPPAESPSTTTPPRRSGPTRPPRSPSRRARRTTHPRPRPVRRPAPPTPRPRPYAAPSPYGQQPSASEQPNPYAYDQDAAAGARSTSRARRTAGTASSRRTGQQPYYGPSEPAFPEAGHAGQPPYGSHAKPWGPTSGKATAVLVLGIAALVLFCCLGAGVIPAIVALVLAPGAKREIVASGGALTGLGQVKAGQIMSVIALVLTVLGRGRAGHRPSPPGAFNTTNSDFSGTF